MASASEILERFQRGPRDIVGIDVGTTSTKVVRIKSVNGEPTLLGAEILPAIELPAEEGAQPAPLVLPPKCKARYAALTFTSRNAVVKLLSIPGRFGPEDSGKLISNLGLENPDKFRVGFKVITEGHGRSESRVLTVAVPEHDAAVGAQLFPVGTPAPFSLEVSGLSTISAFLQIPNLELKGDAFGTIEFGATTTTYALFNRGMLALVRRFNFGTNLLLDRVAESLGVDLQTAQGIVSDGSFDISQSVGEVMQPLLKQLMVSRDFVERRENCRIAKMYVSGGLASSHDSLNTLQSSMDMNVQFWNPFESLTIAKDAVSSDLNGKEWLFAGAVGACLATFEDT